MLPSAQTILPWPCSCPLRHVPAYLSPFANSLPSEDSLSTNRGCGVMGYSARGRMMEPEPDSPELSLAGGFDPNQPSAVPDLNKLSPASRSCAQKHTAVEQGGMNLIISKTCTQKMAGHGHNLALNVSCVPNSLNIGTGHTWCPARR